MVVPPFVVSFGTLIHPCNGQSNGSIGRTTVTGGVPPYSFSWSPQLNLPLNGDPVTGLAPGSYTLRVADNTTNFSTNTYILQDSTVALTLIPGTVTAAVGAYNQISQSYVYGGIAPYHISWNASIEQDLLPKTGLSSGSYTLTVEDEATTTVSHEFVIPDVYEPLQLIPGKVTPAAVHSTGSIAASSVTGGKLPYLILWNFETTADLGAKKGLATGTYSLSVTSADEQMVTHNFIVPEQMVIHFGALNSNKNAIGSTTVSGGVAPFVYAWAHNGRIDGNVTTLSDRSVKKGVHTLVVTDATGQTTSGTFKIL